MNERVRAFRASDYMANPDAVSSYIVEVLREPCSHDELLHALRTIRDVMDDWDAK